MKMNMRWVMAGLAALAMASGVWAKSATELMEEAIYTDHTRGDPRAAITLYDEVLEAEGVTRDQMAKAMYHKGLCQLMLEEERAARATFEKLIGEFAEQSHIIDEAKRVLDELSIPDPATLMPADTMQYIEIGSPGKQVATILNLIQGTPMEDALTGGNGLAAAVLNPSMLAELEKVRGAAVGFTEVKPWPYHAGASNSGILAVLFPGRSDALWGMLKAGIGTAATPGEPIGEFQTASLEGGFDFAYNDTVLLITHGPCFIEEVIAKYMGESDEPSLAKNARFLETSGKERRQNNSLTVWADLDGTYANLVEVLGTNGLPDEIGVYNQLLDINNIDDVLVEIALADDRIQASADAGFKPGHKCLAYHLIRTPELSEKGYVGIPDDAVAMASFALNENMDVERMRELGVDTGLDLLRDLINNVEQLNLFMVKGQPLTNYEQLIARVGLSLTSQDAANTEAMLNQYLVAPYVPVARARAGSANIFSMNPGLVDRFTATAEAGRGAATAGPLASAVAAWPPNLSKAAVINVGGLIEVFAPIWTGEALEEDRVEMTETLASLIDLFKKTNIEVRTVEADDELNVHLSVNGLPALGEAFGPLQVFGEIMEAAHGPKPNRLTHSVGRASAPIEINGVPDAAWEEAAMIELNTSQGEPEVNGTRAKARLLYDDDYLYVLFDVTDAKVVGHPGDFWNSDSVEVNIDAGNDKMRKYGPDDYLFYAHYTPEKGVNYGENKQDHAIAVNWSFNTTNSGYVAEGRFSWDKLGINPQPGTRVGFDLKINECADGQWRVGMLTWNDKSNTAWMNPAMFGTIILE